MLTQAIMTLKRLAGENIDARVLFVSAVDPVSTVKLWNHG
jgi:hypothetical protein